MEDDEPVIALALLYHTKRDGVLERVLESIKRLDYPKYKIHLIFVDNMSTNGAQEVVKSWLDKNSEGVFFY